MPKPVPFPSAAAFRTWLEANHARQPELMVRCYKVHARDTGVTYKEALDEALCFGWIDGVRRAFDEDSFVVRFTPRKSRSKWSAVNIRHFKRLDAAGRVEPPGAAAFRARDRKSQPYSFEARRVTLDRPSARTLKADKKAWAFFQSQPPWYRRTTIYWVMSAKKEDTRARRLAVLLVCSAQGTTIPSLTR